MISFKGFPQRLALAKDLKRLSSLSLATNAKNGFYKGITSEDINSPEVQEALKFAQDRHKYQVDKDHYKTVVDNLEPTIDLIG
jgi:hypothetical protein